MIQFDILRVVATADPDPAKAVEVVVIASDPDAPAATPARNGTGHTLHFPDRASATRAAIKAAMATLEKDQDGNDIPGSSPKDRLVAWVKAQRARSVPKDLTPKKPEDRTLDTVAE